MGHHVNTVLYHHTRELTRIRLTWHNRSYLLAGWLCWLQRMITRR